MFYLFVFVKLFLKNLYFTVLKVSRLLHSSSFKLLLHNLNTVEHV